MWFVFKTISLLIFLLYWKKNTFVNNIIFLKFILILHFNTNSPLILLGFLVYFIWHTYTHTYIYVTEVFLCFTDLIIYKDL